MNKEIIDCAWGDPYFLLEILQNLYEPGLYAPLSIKDCNYAPDLGEEKLLKYCRDITKQTTGREYKYFCITNGATQAINSTLRSWYNNKIIDIVWTSKLGYPFYPNMIAKTGLIHRKANLSKYMINDLKINADFAVIIDSPSNPLGEQTILNTNFNNSKCKIWDAVYHNKIYNACPIIQPNHEVYISSFSKLLGLTGARIGWLATDNKQYFDIITSDSLYENATVSKPSQRLVIDILDQLDLDHFMLLGKNSLDQNRQIVQKLSHLIGTDVQESGMFYCAEVDQKILDIFDLANVKYVVLKEGSEQYIRLNIGQTSDILNKLVNRIQSIDAKKQP